MRPRTRTEAGSKQAAKERLRKQAEINIKIQERLDEQKELTSSAERRLEENVELAAAIASSLGEGVYAFDLNGKITYVNPAAERMLGWSAKELIEGQEQGLAPLKLSQVLTRGAVVHQDEETFVRRDGSTFCASFTSSPVRFKKKIVGGVVAFRDITELKYSNEALRRAEKLVSAGRMAAAMSHEINNPLQAVTNLLLLIRGQELQPETREFVVLAEKELRRISRITQQHLEFYRESAKPVPVDICKILDEVVAIREIQHAWPTVENRREYRVSATVMGYPGEMRQLFANLLSNCVEAGGTQVRIRVTAVSDWKKDPKRKRVRVTVADNASGIPATCKANLFEPFFTTKGEKGNGLGLWVCKGIVVKHDGHIRLRTSTKVQRHGTLISVLLPSLSVRRVRKVQSKTA